MEKPTAGTAGINPHRQPHTLTDLCIFQRCNASTALTFPPRAPRLIPGLSAILSAVALAKGEASAAADSRLCFSFLHSPPTGAYCDPTTRPHGLQGDNQLRGCQPMTGKPGRKRLRRGATFNRSPAIPRPVWPPPWECGGKPPLLDEATCRLVQRRARKASWAQCVKKFQGVLSRGSRPGCGRTCRPATSSRRGQPENNLTFQRQVWPPTRNEARRAD